MKDEKVIRIRLKKSVAKELRKIRDHPRETHDEPISSLVKNAKEPKKIGQYDEFILKIQQAKMKELWDNKQDKMWKAQK